MPTLTTSMRGCVALAAAVAALAMPVAAKAENGPSGPGNRDPTAFAGMFGASYSATPSPPPPTPLNGTWFAGVLTNEAVLQRGADTKAAVFGAAAGVTASTKITVTVAEGGALPTTYTADIVDRMVDPVSGIANLTWKLYLPPHPEQGGNATISAWCSACKNTSHATIRNVQWGDLWVCSGQSNMELPVHYALTRNRTYDLVDNHGAYSNIRLFKRGNHVARWDSELAHSSTFVVPPPAAQPGAVGMNDGSGWVVPNSTYVDSFSAACWFFAQELTDMALDANETPPVLGMIQTAWGGTEIDDWIKNSSIAACKNASGDPEPNRQGPGRGGSGSVYPNNGALWNGMIAPFINMTIYGALWYQGENNVYECMNGMDPQLIRQKQSDGGPSACGNSLASTGYACSMKNLVGSWREQWSAVQGTTDPTFPIGIVSLAAGTSEGHSANMANFRLAQTASYGILPGPAGSGMENTFVAQAYDAGDPAAKGNGRYNGFRELNQLYQAASSANQVDSPYQITYDNYYPGREGYSAGGHQSFTNQFMGGIHPRAKQTVGRRLALGGRAIAYNHPETVYTGPVIKNCSIAPVDTQCVGGVCQKYNRDPDLTFRQVTVNFREDLLKSDAVHVWSTSPDTLGLTLLGWYSCINGTCLEVCAGNASCVVGCIRLQTGPCRQEAVSHVIGGAGNGYNYNAPNHMPSLGGQTISPFEVEVNNSLWIPVAINDQGPQATAPINWGCRTDPKTGGPTCVNGSRGIGWASVTANVPVRLPIGCVGNPWDLEHTGCVGSRAGPHCVNCTHSLGVTGVRYAWGEQPCCPNWGTLALRPCPPNSCPISTFNSTLPAAPFIAKIKMDNDTDAAFGSCECFAPQECS